MPLKNVALLIPDLGLNGLTQSSNEYKSLSFSFVDVKSWGVPLFSNPPSITISTKDGQIDSILSFSRDYMNSEVHLEFDELKKHNQILCDFVKEYHDYEKEAQRLLRELTFFYCYLDKRNIRYIRDTTEGFFAGSFMFDARNDTDFFEKLSIFDNSNPNVIESQTIWTLAGENGWRIKDEISVDDDHLGYEGNLKYAQYLHNLLITN